MFLFLQFYTLAEAIADALAEALTAITAFTNVVTYFGMLEIIQRWRVVTGSVWSLVACGLWLPVVTGCMWGLDMSGH